MRLMKVVLQLRYETTPEQMRYVLAKLRELLLAHPMVTPEPARVRFVGYGTYSKDVEVFAYLRRLSGDPGGRPAAYGIYQRRGGYRIRFSFPDEIRRARRRPVR
jgi:hypothetical protein